MQYDRAKLEYRSTEDYYAAYSSDGMLAINRNYTNTTVLQVMYDADIKSGFHPKRGNKTAEQAIIAHELGHGAVFCAAKKNNIGFDAMARKIIKEANKKFGYTGTLIMAKKISGYAYKERSTHETIAEAVSDVYCNQNKAHAVSKEIVRVLKKYL